MWTAGAAAHHSERKEIEMCLIWRLEGYVLGLNMMVSMEEDVNGNVTEQCHRIVWDLHVHPIYGVHRF